MGERTQCITSAEKVVPENHGNCPYRDIYRLNKTLIKRYSLQYSVM